MEFFFVPDSNDLSNSSNSGTSKVSLVLSTTTDGDLEFVNAAAHLHTRGLETNLRFSYDDLRLFVGYTYADVSMRFDGRRACFPLTARHRLNNVLMYEKKTTSSWD